MIRERIVKFKNYESIEDKERFESWFDEAKFLVSFVRINDF